MPPVTEAMRFCDVSFALAQRVVDRNHDEIFERLDVLGIDRFGSDLHAFDALIAADVDGHRAAGRSAA